jgi:hypothetical protein
MPQRQRVLGYKGIGNHHPHSQPGSSFPGTAALSTTNGKKNEEAKAKIAVTTLMITIVLAVTTETTSMNGGVVLSLA